MQGLNCSFAKCKPKVFQRRGQRSSLRSVQCGKGGPLVVVTREKGKNKELIQRLNDNNIQTLEMPLIHAIPGPEKDKLPEVLKQYSNLNIGWTCLTSPEGAQVFLQGWKKAGKPKASGMDLGWQLPRILTESDKEEEIVLYPTSVRATKDLQSALTDRNFAVIRINTYDTVGVTQIDEEILSKAKDALIVAVASPSAVKAWSTFADEEQFSNQIIACIGGTSAKAAQNYGFESIISPEYPGIDGWVDVITYACESVATIA